MVTAKDPSSARLGERAYWRSLEELARTEDFREHLHREFRSPIDSQWTGGSS
jgi:MoCo/4Fe-4S cofactor protein with predicted Tat translocation signal